MSEWLFLLGIVLLSLAVASGGGLNVAPADFDTSCDQFASAYRSTEKVLMDTQYYPSTILIDGEGNSFKWLSLDFDNNTGASTTKWVDLSQTHTCKHSMTVCGYSDGFQDNWMVTQYINISKTGVTEMVLNISFYAASGLECEGTCSESVGIRIYSTSEPDEEGRSNPANYSANLVLLVHTQGDEPQDFSSHEIPINGSFTGLYLAVVDPPPGSCVGITRIVLFYYVCPEQELNLVKYPEVIAPTSVHINDIVIPAICSKNAVLTSLAKSVECKFRGRWDSNDVVCECAGGYFFNENSNASCEACSPGYYKEGIGNLDSCSPCPNNSHSEFPASTECSCEDGYYRTLNEAASDPCSAPPGPPLNLTFTDITFISATLSWDQPSDLGGRADIYYIITYNNMVITDINSTQYTLTNLLPDMEYVVSITAENSVSNQDNSSTARTITKLFTTLPVPSEIVTSKPLNVGLVIAWEKPAVIIGKIVTYQLLVASRNDTSLASVYNTTWTGYDLSQLDLHPGLNYLWSRAVTTTGIGETSAAIVYSVGTEAKSVITTCLTPLILGLVLGLVVIVMAAILIVIGICHCVKKRVSYKPDECESNTNHLQLDGPNQDYYV